jgi:hypothetical protein
MHAYRINTETASVEVYTSKHEAQKKGNNFPIFTSEAELLEHSSISTGVILDAYNILTNEKVKRFSDRASGVKRLWKALQGLEPERQPEPAAKAPAAKATVTPEGSETKPKKEAKPKGEKTPSGDGSGRKKGTGTFAGKTVYAKVETNPRRAGTAGFKSFEVIRGKKEGVPYAEYLAKGGRPQDLRWDIERKWAEVK